MKSEVQCVRGWPSQTRSREDSRFPERAVYALRCGASTEPASRLDFERLRCTKCGQTFTPAQGLVRSKRA